MKIWLKNNFWKSIFTFFLILWAISNLRPIKDQEFGYFLQKTATIKQSELSKIIKKARLMLVNNEAPTLLVAIKNWSKVNQYDIAKHFSKFNISDVNNINQKNQITLNYLLQKSQSRLKLGLDLKGGLSFILKINNNIKEKNSLESHWKNDIYKITEIISKRINALGIIEPIIRPIGKDKIEIQLPGVSTKENPDAIIFLKKPAKLTFHIVNRDYFPHFSKEIDYPLGYDFYQEEHVDPMTGKVYIENLFLQRVPSMTGSAIKKAFTRMNEYGKHEIILKFTEEGIKHFAEITRYITNINKSDPYNNYPDNHPSKFGRIAIVLDGDICSSPFVREEIVGDSASISGNFTQRQAIELENVLNNPLEYELTVEEVSEIGPTIAQESRKSSIYALIASASSVAVFMALYYFIPGFIAIFIVFINIIIILGILSSLGATITLTGIAALILTIGMAVDANILILERIREEINLKESTTIDSLNKGFSKAFSTIIDANITTLLIGFILISLGSGTIKGFGITLSIGIFTTIFCALIFNRILLEFFLYTKIIKKIIYYNLFKNYKINFLKNSLFVFIFSWFIIIIGFSNIIYKSNNIYGIDFMGGEELVIDFQKKPLINDIYEICKNKNLGEVSCFFSNSIINKNKEYLKIQTLADAGDKIFTIITQNLPSLDLHLMSKSTIGASVSKNIQFNTVFSIFFALFSIFIYTNFRFNINFAIGAFIGIIHDILMTLGIFIISGGYINSSTVAAILMIIGYSINDTIVVFDRIREEIANNNTLTLYTIVNKSINRTLSRTILTSFTTLLSVFALYIFGVSEISDFAFVFLVGIIIGTFSSIFIASPIFYWWHKNNYNLH